MLNIMIARKYRLSRKQINLIYKKGMSRSCGDFGFKFLFIPRDFSRFAVVISGKVAKKASVRNRWRRVIFDELYNLTDKSAIKPGDYLVRVFKSIEDEKKLRLELKNNLKKCSSLSP